MNVKGTIYKVGEVQKISEKFQKREVVIRTGGDYPQLIGCQLTQDKCILIDESNVGDEIDASINIRGREWTNPKDNSVKYFNTIEIWKAETIKVEQNAPEQPTKVSEPDDDMPF